MVVPHFLTRSQLVDSARLTNRSFRKKVFEEKFYGIMVMEIYSPTFLLHGTILLLIISTIR